jgi:type III secretion system low calcium response chaperone LcrH/SycD
MAESNNAKPGAAGMEEKVASMLQDVLAGKIILRGELGLDDNDMEALYSVTYNIYMAGKYQDAARMFGLLGMLDPTDYRFIFGAASSTQMLGQYVLAAMQFQLAAAMDPENPVPMLHTAECLLAVKDRKGAKRALEYVMERSEGKQEYAAIRARAETIMENLAA